MLVSYEKNFLFIHIPKTAGTSVRNSLSPYACHPENLWENRLLSGIGINVNTIGPWQRRRFRPHCSALDIRRNLPERVFSDLFKFAFIRNPWDLLVSLYHFIPSRPRHRHAQRVAAMSFPEFVDEWTRRPEILQSPRICDQSGNLMVDFVGCFERIAQDFQFVCDQIGVAAPLPQSNRSVHADYRTQYTDSLRDVVADRLAQDIEFLGYTFDASCDSPCRTASASVRRSAA